MLIGREFELNQIIDALRNRRSLLVCGPAGSGKSALLEAALASMPQETRRQCLVTSVEGTPHAIWQRLTNCLFEAREPEVIRRVTSEIPASGRFERWLAAQTSLRLRAILRRATWPGQYSFALDAARPVPDAVCRLLKEWIWSGRAPVILLGRGMTESELGRAAKLYWHDGMRLSLGPLEDSAAHALFRRCVARFDLADVADDEFLAFVLQQSGRLPGRILHLCRLAADPRYRFDGRIKTHTLAVDFRLHNSKPIAHAQSSSSLHE
jgi:energy-coupling factor transporter ATP-binding protein EcfA2